MTEDITLRNRNGKWVGIDENGDEVPVPFDALRTDDGRIGDITQDDRTTTAGANNRVEALTQGLVLGEQYRSQAQQLLPYIGTFPHNQDRRPRIAYHSDGSTISELEVAQIMEERDLPWTANLTPRYLVDQDSNTGTDRITVEEAQEIASHGVEPALYAVGDSGENIDDMADDEKLDFLLKNRRDLEELGFNVPKWKQRQGSDLDADEVDTVKDYAIRSTHTVGGNWNWQDKTRATTGWMVPHAQNQLSMQNLQSDREPTGEEMIEIADQVIDAGGDLVIGTHSHEFDTSDGGAFEQFADHLQQRRDAGDVDVVTATGLQLLPHEIDAGPNLWPDPKANGSAIHGPDAYVNIPSDGAVSVGTDGGYDGDNYFILGQDSDYLRIVRPGIGPSWPTAMLDYQARAPTGETATVYSNYARNDSPFADNLKTYDLDDTWTRIRTPIGFSRTEIQTRIQIGNSASGSGAVHVDDIKLYPV